jgi:2-polyprenyl-3-methyl-5-hydroxy-6-metoxy-1,4-benzoquinol methylase
MKNYKLQGNIVNDEEAKKFILNYYNNIKNRSRYLDILSLIGEGYVLDYGCGWGCFSKMISENGNRVLGIDIDEDSLNIAREIIKESDNLQFKKVDIREINDNSFDYVISTQVLEHTHNPGNYLMECNRVLKNEGHLVISIPNSITPNFFITQMFLSKKKFLELNSREPVKTNDHIQAWDPVAFCKLLNSLGFHYEDHIHSEGIPFLKTYLRLKIPFLYKNSYTMAFKFKKEKYVTIKNND